MRYISRFSGLWLAAALSVGSAGVAHAQSALPPVQQQGTVQFVTGGVGLDESTALQQAEPHWPLSLRFTGKHGEFLAGVKVSISNARGKLFRAEAQGPYMLVRLAPGQYTVHADYKGQQQSRDVSVSAQGGIKQAFTWDAN